MRIKEMQQRTFDIMEEYNKKNGTVHSKDASFGHLVEEMGELAREITKEKNDWRGEGFDKNDLAKELVDVICNCLIIASDYDIDVEEVFEKKLAEWRVRWKLDENPIK